MTSESSDSSSYCERLECVANSSKTFACACQHVAYCSAECQRTDWEEHRPSCPHRMECCVYCGMTSYSPTRFLCQFPGCRTTTPDLKLDSERANQVGCRILLLSQAFARPETKTYLPTCENAFERWLWHVAAERTNLYARSIGMWNFGYHGCKMHKTAVTSRCERGGWCCGAECPLEDDDGPCCYIITEGRQKQRQIVICRPGVKPLHHAQLRSWVVPE
jgi:hypothetical protein